MGQPSRLELDLALERDLLGPIVRDKSPRHQKIRLGKALSSARDRHFALILAATLLGRESAFTLPVVLQSYVGEHSAQWGAFAAGAILVSVPVMALVYVAQRQLLSGQAQELGCSSSQARISRMLPVASAMLVSAAP